MGVLQRFERRLEGLVSGAFAKAFKADVQPVEIASALQREIDDKAVIVSRDATMVPNDFVVELSTHDHERLAMYSKTLCDELAAVVREHCTEQGYQLRGDAEVRFVEVGELDIGVHRIRSTVVASVKPVHSAPPQAARPRADQAGEVTQLVTPNPWLEVNGDRHPLSRAVTVLGRGTDVDLRVDDAGVSRRHAEIRTGRPVMLVDLGSTNGTTLDGSPVGRAALYDGARIGLGETVLVFRLPAG